MNDRARTPIVLLHAFPLDARMWAEQVAALEQAGHATMAPNLPGREPDNDLAAWARRVLDLVPGQFVPVGCSMGGYLVFELWRQAPERIPAAVFVDTRAGEDTPETRETRAATIRLLREEGFEAFWAQTQAPRLFGPNAPTDVVERARSIASEQRVENLVASLEALAARPDSRDTAVSMNVPALVVVGEEDVLTPPSESEELAALLPLGRLVRIPGAGHLVPLERPDDLNEELVVSLARLDTAEPS